MGHEHSRTASAGKPGTGGARDAEGGVGQSFGAEFSSVRC